MFDIAPTELMLVALVALVVIGPKDLPRLMRIVGNWVAKARGMARHFRSGMDEMMRQSEIEEMERKWAAENERIMREHPPLREEGAPQMTPLPDAIELEPDLPEAPHVDAPYTEVDQPEAPPPPLPPSAGQQAELPLSDGASHAGKPA